MSTPHMTRREQQVIELLCQGLANKAIARRLGISDSTVKVHLHHMYLKFGVDNRLALAMKKGRELPPGRQGLIGETRSVHREDLNAASTAINGAHHKAGESSIAQINGEVE